MTLEDVLALESLEIKLRAILPDLYQDSYEDILPVSMGSAGLKYDANGQVAWNEMWATFCDLAMAGGPPHRGMLLEPATGRAASEEPEKLGRVVDEIRRGITLVTGLPTRPPSLERGADQDCAVGVECHSIGMAGWLTRAIVMENVLARQEAEMLYLPAGPDFRMAKEIRNVITVIAKTCHYWNDHISQDRQHIIDSMIGNDAADSKEVGLLQPASPEEVQAAPDVYREVIGEISREITHRTGKVCFNHRYTGWVGIECPDEQTAIWLMRAMVVENILARREAEVLFLPVHPHFADGQRIARLVRSFELANRLHGLTKFANRNQT